MIYTDQFCFIHIPRTGGTSITEVLVEQFPLAVVDVFGGKHATAQHLMHNLMHSAEWDRLYKFTVLRPPHDIIASDWRHTRSMAERITARTALEVHPDWLAKMRRVAGHQSFSEFVEREYLTPHSYIHDGGFWRTFCTDVDGAALGVQVIPYADLPNQWPEICRRLGMDHAPSLPRINQTVGETIHWDVDLWDRVAEKCRLDLKEVHHG